MQRRTDVKRRILIFVTSIEDIIGFLGRKELSPPIVYFSPHSSTNSMVWKGPLQTENFCFLFLQALVLVTWFASATDPIQSVPPELLSAFGQYPNILQLSDAHRKTFHPVLLVPKGTTPKPLDYRNAKGLASPQAITRARRWRWLTRHVQRFRKRHWSIGRYDENREAMYSSEHFQNLDNHIDGYGGRRTVHLGIDLGAPVGTKVYAFTDGIVHSLGYNPQHGDYGHVIVIQHTLPSGGDVWALYGHLDQSTFRGKQRGTRIRKGQVIGRLGDCHENGGWEAPHVHFQLATSAPETHDMPGASSVEDRVKALLEYPDPRYVLGPLY